jgi:hypothetical protein
MLAESAETLAKLLHDPATGTKAASDGAQAMMHELATASAEEKSQAVRTLSAAVATLESPTRAAFAATAAGALIEGDADPRPLVEPLVKLLHNVTPPAVRLFEASAVDDPAAKDAVDQFEANLKRIAPTMPDDAKAWEALQRLYPPVVAVCSVAPEARAAARDLVPTLTPMSRYNPSAHWIVKMLRVLDNEPYLAIEPETQLGIRGRMSGISENFQLNVLLMDIFPAKRSWLSRPKRRVSEAAARVSRGEGPQQLEESVTGFWNLYSWHAVKPDGTLPAYSDHNARGTWIWNEAVPADIPTFEGHRVILLGPASYQRGWDAQRDFLRLKAELTIDEQLSAHDVQDWLNKMARANAS